MVIDAEGFRHQRLEVADLGLGLELELFAGRQLVTRRNPDHVAVLALVEPLGLQNDVERLIPGHVLEAQREAALNGFAGDDVEVGEIGDHLQNRTHIDVLEVERELFALIALVAALHQLGRILDDALDLDHELIVALVGIVLPQSLRRDGHLYVATLLLGDHAGDRGAEIGDIEATTQRLRQVGLHQVDHEVGTLATDIDRGVRRAQVYDDSRLAICAAAEIDIANGAIGPSGRRHGLGIEARERRSRGGPGGCLCGRDGNEHILAVKPGFIGHRAIQVQHQPGAIADLHDIGAAQIARIEALDAAAEAIAGVHEIESDARRRHHAETRRRRAHWLLHGQAHHHLAAILIDLQGFNAVADDHLFGRGRFGGAMTRDRKQDRCGAHRTTDQS